MVTTTIRLRFDCRPTSNCSCKQPLIIPRSADIFSSTNKFCWSLEKFFYRVFKCILSRSKTAQSEISVERLKAFYLPLVLYGSEAVDLSASNIGVLDNCLIRAVCRTFGVGSESLWQLRECLGLFSIRCLIENRKGIFFDLIVSNDNYNIVLHVMLCNYTAR